MPYPNEHTARQTDPGKYKKFARGHPKGFPKGVDVIYGISAKGKSEIQSIRFDKKKWTSARAKAWLKAHKFKAGGFEAAAKAESVSKDLWNGVI